MDFRNVAVACALVISGCATQPKTASEFRRFSIERHGQHVLTVNSPLEVVMARIDAHAAKCTSFRWTYRQRGGLAGHPGMKYSDSQNVRWENRTGKMPTFVITKEGTQDLNKQPGGFFMFLIDLKGDSGRTRVTMYDYNFSWGYYDWASEYKQVVAGKRATCQLEKI